MVKDCCEDGCDETAADGIWGRRLKAPAEEGSDAAECGPAGDWAAGSDEESEAAWPCAGCGTR